MLEYRPAVARPAAKGEHGCHAETLGRERGVAHRVNPAMHAVQQALGHTMLDRPLAKATTTQLIDSQHPVLLLSDFGNPQAASGDFHPHEGA